MAAITAKVGDVASVALGSFPSDTQTVEYTVYIDGTIPPGLTSTISGNSATLTGTYSTAGSYAVRLAANKQEYSIIGGQRILTRRTTEQLEQFTFTVGSAGDVVQAAWGDDVTVSASGAATVTLATDDDSRVNSIGIQFFTSPTRVGSPPYSLTWPAGGVLAGSGISRPSGSSVNSPAIEIASGVQGVYYCRLRSFASSNGTGPPVNTVDFTLTYDTRPLRQPNICIDTNNQAATVTLATDDDSRVVGYDLFFYENTNYSNAIWRITWSPRGNSDNLPSDLIIAGTPSNPQIQITAGSRRTLFCRFQSESLTAEINSVDFTLTYDTRGPTLEQPDVTISTNGPAGSWQLEEGRYQTGAAQAQIQDGFGDWNDIRSSTGNVRFNSSTRTLSIQANIGSSNRPLNGRIRYGTGSWSTFTLRYHVIARTAPYLVQGDVRVETDGEAGTVTLAAGSVGFGTGSHSISIDGTSATNQPVTHAATGISATQLTVRGPYTITIPGGIRGTLPIAYQLLRTSAGRTQGVSTVNFALIYNTTSCGQAPVAPTVTADIQGSTTAQNEGSTRSFGVTVGGTATGDILYAWDITTGDGRVTSGAAISLATVLATAISANSSYTLRVRVTREGVTATDTVTVPTTNIAAPPLTAALRGSDAAMDEGQERDFSVSVGGTATGAIGYSWTVVGDAVITGNTDEASVTIRTNSLDAQGSYYVGCEVTRDGNTVNVRSANIAVRDIGSISVTIDGDSTDHTEGTTRAFAANVTTDIANPATSYDWTVIGDAEIVGSRTGSSITVRADQISATGSYRVFVSATARGVVARAGLAAITTRDAPTLTAAITGTTTAHDERTTREFGVTVGGSATGAIGRRWRVTGDASIPANSTGATVVVTSGSVGSTGGSYTLECRVERDGINVTESVSVTVNDTTTLTASITGSTSAHDEKTTRTFGVTLGGNAVGTANYAWSITGDASIPSNSTGDEVVVTAASVGSTGGSYRLQCRVARDGAVASDTVNVTVADTTTLTVALTGETKSQAESTIREFGVTLGGTATGTATYVWSVTGDASIPSNSTGDTVDVTADSVSATGSYVVTCAVTREGVTASSSETVPVHDTSAPLVVSIAGDATGTQDEGTTRTFTVTVTGSATGAITRAWSVTGDASIPASSTGATVVVTAAGVNAAGSYTVTCAVTRSGSTVSASQTVVVNDTTTLTVALTGSAASQAESTTRTFGVSLGGTATGAATYVWSVTGDASIPNNSTGDEVVVTAASVTADGSYTVTCAVARDGKTARASRTVTVNDTSTLSVSITGTASAQVESTTRTFTAVPAGTEPGADSLAWSITGAGTIPDPSTGTTVEVTSAAVDAASAYTLTVVLTRGSKTARASQVIVVNDASTLTASITGSTASQAESTTRTFGVTVGGTEPGATTYAWSVTGDGSIPANSTGATVVVTTDDVPPAGGRYQLTVAVTKGSKTARSSVVVEVTDVVPLRVSLEGSTEEQDEGTERNFSAVLTGDSAASATLAWTITGDGTVTTSATVADIVVLASGVDADGGSYELTVTATSGSEVVSESATVAVANKVAAVTAEITGLRTAQDERTNRTFGSTVGGTAVGTIAYRWSVSGDGSISGSATGDEVVVRTDSVSSTGGDYTLSLRVTREGESVTVSTIVPVADTGAELTASIVDGTTRGAPASTVNGDTAQDFTCRVGGSATGAITYSWSVTGDGEGRAAHQPNDYVVEFDDVETTGSATLSCTVTRGGHSVTVEQRFTVRPVVLEIAVRGATDTHYAGDLRVFTADVLTNIAGTTTYGWSIVGGVGENQAAAVVGDTDRNTMVARALLFDETNEFLGTRPNYIVVLRVGRGGVSRTAVLSVQAEYPSPKFRVGARKFNKIYMRDGQDQPVRILRMRIGRRIIAHEDRFS